MKIINTHEWSVCWVLRLFTVASSSVLSFSLRLCLSFATELSWVENCTMAPTFLGLCYFLIIIFVRLTYLSPCCLESRQALCPPCILYYSSKTTYQFYLNSTRFTRTQVKARETFFSYFKIKINRYKNNFENKRWISQRKKKKLQNSQ